MINFTAQPFEQKVIAADGSTVIEIFYDRDRYNLTWDFGPGTRIGDYIQGSIPVGTMIEFPVLGADVPMIPMGYDKMENYKMPAHDEHISALWNSTLNNHTLQHIPGQTPTHKADGYKGFYTCIKCGKNFTDYTAETEIPDIEAWIAGEGKLPMLPYTMLEGMNSECEKGSGESLHFRADGAFSDFAGAAVDGVMLDPSSYTAQEGSTIVNLKAEYLDTLQSKEHTLAIVFTNGRAETTFKVKQDPVDPDPIDPDPSKPDPDPSKPDSSKPNPNPETPKSEGPKTGDSFAVMPRAVLSLLSLGTALLLSLSLKKQGRRK